MANVNDYNFNAMSRIGLDHCSLDETDIQNVKSNSYLLTNHYVNDCTMQKPINFALNQPNVFYSGSKQVGLGGCNIDENSELTIGSKVTKDKGKIYLQERPYLTVPFLAKGRGNSDLEIQLLTGENQMNRKTANPSSETSYMEHKNYPLIPSIEESIANPENLIESAADENWIRGGLPSRDLIRDNKQ
jgi:hypothetical protein